MNYLATFNTQLTTYGSAIDAEIAGGNAATFYSTSYYIDGLLSAVEAMLSDKPPPGIAYYVDGADVSSTSSGGPIALMNTVVGYIDAMLGRPWDPLAGNDLLPEQLYTFQGMAPIARAAAIILTNKYLRLHFADKARKYVDFVDRFVIKLWFDKDVGVYNDLAYPPSGSQPHLIGVDTPPVIPDFDNPPPPDFTVKWPDHLAGCIPWLDKENGGWGRDSYTILNDKCTMLGSIATSLYAATGSPVYLEIARRVGEDFKTRLSTNGTGWVWDTDIDIAVWLYEDWVGKNWTYKHPMHDTSHANREPRMMVMMYEAGIVFTLADVVKMAHTLTDVLWNGSTSVPLFTNYLDGDNGSAGALGSAGDSPGGIGNIYPGWALLGRYSAKACTVIEATLTAVLNGQSVGQNYTSYGKIALSGHLLRGLSAPRIM